MKSGYEVIREGGTLDEALAASNIGEGWRNKLIPLVRTYLPATDPDAKFYQIKEKFAALRIYADPISPEGQWLLYAIEESSKSMCEECGEVGKIRFEHLDHKYFSWLKTLCDTHAKEKRYKLDA